MGRKNYSLQKRLQIYVVITIVLVAFISSFISGYIYFRSSVSDFYAQADSTLTYFENAILRQKLRESSSSAARISAMPETVEFLSTETAGELPAALSNAIETDTRFIAFLDTELNLLFSTEKYNKLYHNNFASFLHRRFSLTDINDVNISDSTNSVELSTVSIPDDSFYYGDLMGNFLAMAAVPVYKDSEVSGYVVTGFDLTDPAYTDYIGRYFGLVSTIFYQDIRVNTNIANPNKNYLNTTMDTYISNTVFKVNGYYSGTVTLGETKYIGTYKTLSDNIYTVGAVFIGIRLSDMLINQRLAIYLISAASVVIAISAIFLTRRIINKHIGQPIGQTIDLLQKMAHNPAALATEDIAYTGEKSLNKLIYSLKATASAIADDRAHLAYLAFHDRLTGLYNSKRLFDRYSSIKHYSSSDNLNSPAIVLTVNIDFFKRHKKYLGQQYSEKLLLAVSVRLNEVTCKYSCDLYRMTSDEFIVCSDIDLEDKTLDGLIENILNHVRNPFDINEKNLLVTVSIGAARKDRLDDTIQTMMQKSGIALDIAKYAGRNRSASYDPETAEMRQRYLFIEEKLRSINDYSCFKLHYQPQIDIRSGSIYGLEALIRWHDPELGWISPAEFIPLAETIGMISPIGNWVTSTALSFLKNLNQLGYGDIHMSINVAAAQIIEPDFVFRMMESAKSRQLKPSQIVLEITESQLMESFEKATDSLKLLQKHGFIIAMDDFGTGYSSLSYISNLPVSIIKIDQSFVQSIESEVSLELVKEMITLGNRLNMTVISEGVETANQLQQLQDIDCSYIQGYYVSRPMPEADTVFWIEDNYKDSRPVFKNAEDKA